MANSQKVDNSALKIYLQNIWEGLVDICLEHQLSDADIARVFKVNRSTITRYKAKVDKTRIVTLGVGSRSIQDPTKNYKNKK